MRGLGLDERLEPQDSAQGMVGQRAARKAAGMIVKIVQNAKIAGRAMLMAGRVLVPSWSEVSSTRLSLQVTVRY